MIITGYGFTGDGPNKYYVIPGESAMVSGVHAGDNGYSDSKHI